MPEPLGARHGCCVGDPIGVECCDEDNRGSLVEDCGRDGVVHSG